MAWTLGVAADGLDQLVARGPLARWLDAANPLMVRQVRQQLRSRVFQVIIAVLPAACVVAALLATAGDPLVGGLVPMPALLFALYVAAWSLIVGVIQPAAAAGVLVRERQANTWELVELAGMTPRSVLTGLLAAALVQSLLYSAIFAPFLVLTWLLRGIGFAHLCVVLVLVPLWAVTTAALALAGSCRPGNKTRRGNQVGTTFGLAMMWLMTLGILATPSRFSPLELFASALARGHSGAWLGLALTLNVWAAVMVTALTTAALGLTHPAENHSTTPRLLAFALFLNGVAWALAMPAITGADLGSGLLLAACTGLVLAIKVGVGGIAEHDGATARQARWIDTATGWRRAFSSLLGPGRRRGTRAFLAMVAASLTLAGAGVALGATAGGYQQWPLFGLYWGAVCYLAAWFALGDWLTRRLLLQAPPHSPRLQRGLTLGLALVPFMATGLAREFRAWWPFNPYTGITSFAAADASPLAPWCVSLAGCVGLAYLAWVCRDLAQPRLRLLDSGMHPVGRPDARLG